MTQACLSQGDRNALPKIWNSSPKVAISEPKSRIVQLLTQYVAKNHMSKTYSLQL